MGKLVVTEFVTLDGVFEDPGGSEQTPNGGWAFRSDSGEEGLRFKFDELMAADAQLLGRRTYEGFAAAWPSMNEDDFGRKMNEMPKFVVSSTLTEPTWTNTTVIGYGDVPELRDRYDGDLLVAGSGRLARALLDDGLVDELRLMVHPVMLGSGRRLFDGAQLADFELVEARQANEVAILVLRPKGA